MIRLRRSPEWTPVLISEELAAADRHAELAGLAQFDVLRRTDRGVTLRGRRPGEDWSVAIKLYAGPEGFAAAKRIYAHHLRSYESCLTDPALRVPEPLRLFERLPGYAMRWAHAPSAASIVKWKLLERGAAREACLARAARWLDSYHEGGGRRPSRVAPGFLVDELAHALAAHGEAGLGRHRPEFEHLRQRLRDAAERLGRFAFPKANLHGDFNLHNVLIDGDTTWALDFAGRAGNVRPVTFDIACCLFFLEFRDGWKATDRRGTPGGFDRRAIEIFARAYPGIPWDSAETAWLLLHHQLWRWTSFERLNLRHRSAQMSAICRYAAETLEMRLRDL